MATLTDPRYVVALDDADQPCDVVDALAVGSFACGDRPWARTVRIERVRADAALLPAGADVIREAADHWHTVILAEGPGWTAWVTRRTDRSANVTVFATSAAVGEPALAEATDGAAEPEVDDGVPKVPMGFWHQAARSAERRVRPITVQPWKDIRANYSAPVAEAFDHLTALTPETLSGRLLLLHGPPGTGKTTAKRALAHAWEPWCQFDYVIDPERLLADPGYLMSAALSPAIEDDDTATRWRLLLLEDCDELICPGAKSGSGQALSRLLNLTDGLLGQGLDLVVAISTNEPLANLHPAVVRPGRCIAQVEVGALSPSEARRWLGHPCEIAPHGATLAELYAKRGELRTVNHREERAVVGQYL